jgi:anaerobic selenocysteine-containing dehydrogenase
VAERALRSCRLTVHISTKLNRTHLVPGDVSLILPTLGRTEVDHQVGGPQFVTIEDSFGTVHRSVGKLDPPSQEVRSEVAIVAGIAARLVPDCGVPWKAYVDDYRAIRADVAAIVPGFERFEERVLEPGGFLLPHPPRDRREFPTPSGKAQLSIEALHSPYGRTGELVLQTLRSHDQFNTTIYGLDDRYRGVSGGRRVVFINQSDISRLGLEAGGLVDIVAGERTASRFRLVPYETPTGCIAAYYPEANVLVGLDDRSSESGTPSYKSISVTLHASR